MPYKQLPIKLVDNFQVGFFYYFPLGCILSHKEYHDWYYMNYIDVVGVSRELIRNEKFYVNFDLRFPDGESYFSRRISSNSVVIFDEYDLELIQIKDGIINFIKKNIYMEKYLIIYINMAQVLIEKNSEMVTIHDVFVYGYNDITQTVNIGYMINRQYKLLEVPYEIFEKGFEDYLNYISPTKGKKKLINTFYLTNSIAALDANDVHCFTQHEYDETIVLKKLYSYLSGKISSGSILISDKRKVKSLYCGIDSYNLFYDYLNELKGGNAYTTPKEDNRSAPYDFMFPFYYENHKKGILERLQYAYSMTGKEIYNKVGEEYVQVVEQIELIKNKHVKLFITEQPLTIKIYDEFSFSVEELRDLEKNILSKLF